MINNGNNDYDQMKKFIGIMKTANINESNNKKQLLKEAERELTDEEFVEEKDKMETAISRPIEIDVFNVYDDNVEVSFSLIREGINVIFSLDDPDGIYLTLENFQLNEHNLEILNNLRVYYNDEFVPKWSQEIS